VWLSALYADSLCAIPYTDDNTSETCPPALYTTEILPCDNYTLNIVVSSDQEIQLRGFDFVPCRSDDDPASALAYPSTTTAVAASSATPVGIIAVEEKPTARAGVIIGAVVGALAFLLAGLALFVLLRHCGYCRRRRRDSLPPPRSSPLMPFTRSRPWHRLSGHRSKPSSPSAQFLAHVTSPPADNGENRLAHAAMLDPPAKQGPDFTSAALAPAPDRPDTTGAVTTLDLPWWSVTEHARDGRGNVIVEKQPLRLDNADADVEVGGLAVARGYLPDSKELMAWQEQEQTGAQGGARTSLMEALPLYQARASLQRSS